MSSQPSSQYFSAFGNFSHATPHLLTDKSAHALTMPYTDLQGRVIQLWKWKDHLFGSVLHNGKMSIIPGTKVYNGLLPQENDVALISRFEKLTLRKWGLGYLEDKKKIVVWPYLIAAAGNDIAKTWSQRKIDNAKEALNTYHYNAAKRDQQKQFVKFKDNGDPFDHVQDVNQKQRCLKKVIVSHQKTLRQEKLNPQERQRIEKELSEASKWLDSSEKYFNSEPYKSPGTKQLEGELDQTGLRESYNSSHPNNPMAGKGEKVGDIGGVACSTEYIKGLFDQPESLFEGDHYFCFPTLEKGSITNGELQQILRELAIGVYAEGAFPFFSLHFREKNHDLFPVLHPIYKNTLVGRTIGMLDHQMKGYLNGGEYADDLLDVWYQNPDWDNRSALALASLIDFSTYCKTALTGADSLYVSLRMLVERVGLFREEGIENLARKGEKAVEKLLVSVGALSQGETSVLTEYEGFKNSFRIIAKQNNLHKEGPVFIVNGDFDVEYTIEPSPQYKEEMEQYIRRHGAPPPSYQNMVFAYEMMAKRIHDHMVKLPICKKYFAMLSVISFFSSYFSTLKKHRKIPVLPSIQRDIIKGCPPLFPHLPISATRTETIQVNLHEVIKAWVQKNRSSIVAFLKEGMLDKRRLGRLDSKNHLQSYHAHEQDKIIEQLKIEFEKDALRRVVPSLRHHLEKNREILKFDEEARSFYKKGVLESFENSFNNDPSRSLNLLISNWLNNDSGFLSYIDQEATKHLDRLEKFLPNEVRDCAELTCNIPRLISELSPEEAQFNRRVVGGCGLKLQPIEVEPSKKAADILENSWQEMLSARPETWMELETDGQEGTKTLAFRLSLEDVPADLSDNYQWMKTHLFTPHPEQGKIEKFLHLKEAILKNDQTALADLTAELASITDFEGRSLMHYGASIRDPFYVIAFIQSGFAFPEEDHQGYRPIHYAAMEGNSEVVQALLSYRREDLNVKNKSGATPMIVAIQHGHFSIVKHLLQSGATPTLLSSGYNDLHVALQEGNIAITEAILENAVFVSFCLAESSAEGGTPLMLACELDNPDLVKRLITLGAIPSVKQKNGTTALSIAIKRDCLPVLRELLSHIALSDTDKEVALKCGSSEVISLLEGQLLHYKNSYKDNCLHLSIANGNISAALYFAKKESIGIYVNGKNEGNETPTQMALQLGAWELLEALVEKGGKISIEDLLKLPYDSLFEEVAKKAPFDTLKLQEYLLIAAQAGNYLAISNFLLPKGADLSTLKGPNDWCALHYLAKCDGIFLFRAHVASSGDFEQPLSKEGHKTLAYIAAENGSQRVLRFLLEQMKNGGLSLENNCRDKHLLCGALEQGHEEAARLIIEHDSVEIANKVLDKEGSLPAHLAARIGAKDLLELLFKKGANFQAEDASGYRPIDYLVRLEDAKTILHFLQSPYNMEVTSQSLFLAALKSREILSILIAHNKKPELLGEALFKAVKSYDFPASLLLLAKGASTSYVSTNGLTPLLLAAQTGQESVLQMLLAKGEKHEQDFLGNTPLHYSAENGHASCCHQLCMAGYNPRTVNKQGKSPLQFAGPHQGVSKVLNGLFEAYSVDVKEFLHAVKQNNLEAITAAIRKLPINEKISCGTDNIGLSIQRTLLQHIVAECNEETALLFLNHVLRTIPTFKPNIPDYKGNTLAHYFVIYNVQPSILTPFDLRVKNHKGQTPYHLGAQFLKASFFEHLLHAARHEDLEEIDHEGRTPVFYAIEGKKEKNLQLLVDLKVNSNVWDFRLITPLSVATKLQRLGDVKALLKGSANPNQPATIERLLPLHIALAQDDTLLARTFILQGVKCDVPTKEGIRPVHVAAEKGNSVVLGLLTGKGVSFEVLDNRGFKPVHNAARSGKLQTLKALVKLSDFCLADQMDLDESENKDMSLLQVAALSGQPATFNWLVKQQPGQMNDPKLLAFAAMSQASTTILPYFYPFTISVQPEALCKAATHAIMVDNVDSVRELYLRGIPTGIDVAGGETGLHLASRFGSLLSTQWFLKQGLDPDHRSATGENALEIAAANGSFEQFRLLLDFASYDLSSTNSRGQTLLYLAAAAGNIGHVLILLEKNAPVESTDSRLYTPLHIAAKNGHTKVVRLLLALGANSSALSLNSETPFDLVDDNDLETIETFKTYDFLLESASEGSSFWHLAIRGNHMLALQFLTFTDATDGINVADSDGRTPLHLAVSLGKKEFVLHLLRHGAKTDSVDKWNKRPADLARDELMKQLLVKAG